MLAGKQGLFSTTLPALPTASQVLAVPAVRGIIARRSGARSFFASLERIAPSAAGNSIFYLAVSHHLERSFDRRRQLGQQRCQEAKLIGDRTKLFPAPDLMHLHYQDLVQRGLQQIKLEHRAVLVLHDLEELPQKEVAQILGIPVGTVKSRLFHARAAMRQFLEAQGVQL